MQSIKAIQSGAALFTWSEKIYNNAYGTRAQIESLYYSQFFLLFRWLKSTTLSFIQQAHLLYSFVRRRHYSGKYERQVNNGRSDGLSQLQ